MLAFPMLWKGVTLIFAAGPGSGKTQAFAHRVVVGSLLVICFLKKMRGFFQYFLT
jgi:hypothetical protein